MIQSLQNPYHTSNDKVKCLFENIVFIEEEWFDYIILTNSLTFTTALIKYAESRFNQEIKFPLNTKQYIQEIAINNDWNIHIVHILLEKRDGKFLFKMNSLSKLPNNFGLPHEWIKTNFKYLEPQFFYRFFDDSESGPF